MRLPIVLTLLLCLTSPLLAQSGEGSAVSLSTSPILRDYAQFEVGETFFKAGNYAAAIPEYYKVVTENPGSLLLPRANQMLGKCYFNLKNYEKAIKAFHSLVQKYPDAKEAAEARYLTARALEKGKRWKEAFLAYENVDLYHPLSYFGKQSRLAIKALKRAHKKQLPRFKASAEALHQKGMTYFNQDDFEMASIIFSRLAREYPKYKRIGEIYLMLGRAEEQANKPAAISDLERATNFSGRANYYLGLAYGRRGDYERAIIVLKRVPERYPDSDLADEAAYWAAYYRETSGDLDGALKEYYDLIDKYPYSKSVPAAIWRLGRAYYWTGDFKNAATYLHLAQLYPPSEDTPRCMYFEGKALERAGNRAAALAVYEKLTQRYDHTYYAYRALEKLRGSALAFSEQSPFNGEEFFAALDEVNDSQREELAAIMEIWEETKADSVKEAGSAEVQTHLAKYKELMSLGLTRYAADEARYLVNITTDADKDTAQTKLGEMLINSGNYRTPIRYADRKIKAAILAGAAQSIPKKIWQFSYPKGYWKSVAESAADHKLDPYLVLAVIREESRFNSQAVSRSGARGLMQIMPRTGRGIAKKLELKKYRTGKLFSSSLNVEMGTYYLSNLVDEFSGNVYLSLAGYNGGPNRIRKYVKNWYNGNLNLMDIDEFIESIPVREMRLYVQKVMGSYFEYKRLYDRKRS